MKFYSMGSWERFFFKAAYVHYPPQPKEIYGFTFWFFRSSAIFEKSWSTTITIASIGPDFSSRQLLVAVRIQAQQRLYKLIDRKAFFFSCTRIIPCWRQVFVWPTGGGVLMPVFTCCNVSKHQAVDAVLRYLWEAWFTKVTSPTQSDSNSRAVRRTR